MSVKMYWHLNQGRCPVATVRYAAECRQCPDRAATVSIPAPG